MPPPRISESAEAARAAALQAEFNEKKWVWVPDEKEGYLGGWVVEEDGDIGEVVMATGGEIRKVPLYALSKMNPPKFDRVDDIADLTFLNEASVVHNLRLRYGSGAIYTYSGLFLVAINPYTILPLYTDTIIQQYRGKRKDENPPHIFAIAERAWTNMMEERENQSILITGESGAGKTENTKKVIQYLAAIAADSYHAQPQPHIRSSSGIASSLTGSPSTSSRSNFKPRPQSSSASKLGILEHQILQANPILEAFGNAQTQRNNNSSRFGKFIRIGFSLDGSIAGANIDWYLLEKSRVVARSEAERSFHVFYHLLEGGEELKDILLLEGSVEDYEYLKHSRATIDGVDDRDEWRLLKNALEIVGFTQNEQLELFKVVAAILHIGNIEITGSDQAQIRDPSRAEKACHLLGLSVQEFTKAVLRPRVLAGREWVTQARTKQQATDELSSLCKTLYEKSFGALVDRVNRALERPTSKSTFIGVLDIAGFEIFNINGFEQLMINYTNEKLQQFFNHHMFVLEQEEYQRERIEWDFVNFGLDLQPTIDLIESSGNVIGILSCLDEECIMPKATDLTFTNKLHYLWNSDIPESELLHSGRSKYSRARFDQGEGFIIQHYAGKVEYRTDGWLDKNKDPLNDNLGKVLASSSERSIASLFEDYNEIQTSATIGKKRTLKKGAFRTVSQRHKEQLASLMAQLQATQPHFVRCIVPNQLKKPGKVDIPLILDQLRCNGVLEGIRIARLGYPNRLPFLEFRQRYEVLTPGVIPKGYMDGRKACLRMVDALELDKTVFKIGTSKVFFKAGVLAELEERRDALLYDVFSRFQAVARMWSARRQMKKILNRAVAVRTIQRNARIYGELKSWPWWQLYTKVRPLLAATRNDEELRKKEAELELVRERAERDQREKEALEALKMRLEQEKRKVEVELEAERNLAIDKDALLERSKKRESELEEEAIALQADIETLESQLDRAMSAKAAVDKKYEGLKDAFDEASSHLARLEKEVENRSIQEADIVKKLKAAEESITALTVVKEDSEKAKEELQLSLVNREEDIVRVKERMDVAVSELRTKLLAEIEARDAGHTKAEALEKEVRQSKEQIMELTRTAIDYANIIRKKEADINRLTKELTVSKEASESLAKQIAELQTQLAQSTSKLKAQAQDRERDNQIRIKLQIEIDELRSLIDAKTSEASKHADVERIKEQELTNLRKEADTLQGQLIEVRRVASEEQTRLKLEVDTLQSQLQSLERIRDGLSRSEIRLEEQRKAAETALIGVEKAKRSAELELQAIRIRQIEADNQLAEAIKSKENLERQLTAAQSKHQDYEDAILQTEREKDSWVRQLQGVKKQLDSESAKRSQLEQTIRSHNSESVKLKDRISKLEKELKKALDDIHKRDWEISQLRSRQDKTIVEHVHVLEEAKKVTDRQLADAQLELQSQVAYIRSLEKTKSRLAGEAEDLVREVERERAELRVKAKAARQQEEKAQKALSELEKERKLKDKAEAQVRKLQTEMQHRLDDDVYTGGTWKKEKDRLETKIGDLTAAYEASNNTNTEQQTQIVSLLSQVRELRAVLDEAEADRTALQKARRQLEGRLNDIAQDHLEKMSSDRALQAMHLEKQELRSALEEQQDKVNIANERLKKAEVLANERRTELDKSRAENAELDKQNTSLQKQIKELNLRIINLETKLYNST